MKFKPYEEYKKVDLPWIDEIPSYWEMERNKNFLTIKDETVGNKDKDYKLLSLTKKGIIERDMENPKGKFPSSFETYKIVEKNDIIFCLFDIDETPRTVGLSKLDGMITGAYNIFSINKINRNYYYYYYLYLDKFKMLKPLYTGLRKTINEDAFLRLRTPLPPKEEQNKISDFLDYKLGKIDKFVELTKKQIGLLKEQREVIINDSVTKGVNKNVEYKDSGIDWIGDIPEHWEVTRLKRVSYMIKTGGTPKNLNEKHLSKNGLNWYSPGDFKNGLILDKANRKLSEEGENLVNIFPENSILIIGIGGTLGKVGLVKSKFSCNQQINVITPNCNLIDSTFLLYFLYSSKKAIIKRVNYTTLPILNQEETGSLLALLPQKKEQEEIVSYIEKETSKIDRTIELYKSQIELIKEYRTSLIASAVTGKIDVRDF